MDTRYDELPSVIDDLTTTLWLYALVTVTVVLFQLTLVLTVGSDDAIPCPTAEERAAAGILLAYDAPYHGC